MISTSPFDKTVAEISSDFKVESICGVFLRQSIHFVMTGDGHGMYGVFSLSWIPEVLTLLSSDIFGNGAWFVVGLLKRKLTWKSDLGLMVFISSSEVKKLAEEVLEVDLGFLVEFDEFEDPV